MRRDIWLAGVAGAVVGSWLTLVAVQFAGHGFDLHGRGGETTAENKSAATQSDTAKAETTLPKAIETPKPAEATKDKATILAAASPSTSSTDSSPALSAAAMAAAAAASTGDETKVEENKPAAAQPVTQQDSKVPTDTARSNDVSTKPEEAQASLPAADTTKDKDTSAPAQPANETKPDKPAVASSDTASSGEAKTDPIPDNRIPADQIDRETAAAEHRTLSPVSPQQQVQPKPQSEPQPQSEQAALDPASKPQEQTTIELVRPFSDQAGILTISGRSVQLTGIVPTDVDRMCTGPSGKDWPCGQAARAAFRMYLRGRSIDCDVPDANWKGTIKGTCRYVRIDLSAWLVRFGWADPEPGSPLAALVDEAKEKKRGIYGDDPRKSGKSTLAPPPAKEDPLHPI